MIAIAVFLPLLGSFLTGFLAFSDVRGDKAKQARVFRAAHWMTCG